MEILKMIAEAGENKTAITSMGSQFSGREAGKQEGRRESAK